MGWWEAILLGVVEGATEYLPVSSTGHLLLVQRAIGITHSDEANAYAICIQAGAILAVAGLYQRRMRQMAAGVWEKLRGQSAEQAAGWRLAVNLAVAFLPAGVVGWLLDDWVEERLFGLWPVVIAWAVGGIAILAVGASSRSRLTSADGIDIDGLSWQRALLIGAIQCLALWPGTSRSLVTILAGVLVGMQLTAAVEFSFLLGVITLLAATAYKALDAGEAMLAGYGPVPLILGCVTAWISAVVAVRWMLAYLKTYGLSLFGYYRIGLAILVAGLILSGRLQP